MFYRSLFAQLYERVKWCVTDRLALPTTFLVAFAPDDGGADAGSAGSAGSAAAAAAFGVFTRLAGARLVSPQEELRRVPDCTFCRVAPVRPSRALCRRCNQ